MNSAKPVVRVVRLTGADRPLIERQRVCPVMGSLLGEHGEPVKLMIGEEPLLVCCQGCVGKVKMNPGKYLAKAARRPARPVGYER